MFYAVLVGILGNVLLGGPYDTLPECKHQIAQDLALFAEEVTSEKPNHSQMLCVQFEPPLFETRDSAKA